ncbi:MAG: peptidoglycan DD-metalloendopeptidase family protein [Chloroflexi bacterium]|nr:peptidoglycan DD-metalloendopeptidase family protein [Chloroflexota bacterium]
MFRKLLYSITILALLNSSIAPVTVSATARPPSADSRLLDDETVRLSDYLTPPDSTMELTNSRTIASSEYDIPAVLEQPTGPYRTTVRIRGTADLARLKKIGVTILAATKSEATVIADRTQLEQLAKLQFTPRNTELTERLQTAGGGRLSAVATSAQILAAVAADSDNDGLDDTEEGWWCTNPNLADSDNDRVNDGDEVDALREWIQHTRSTRPASGKPFAGWPPDHTGCYDSDLDSVPDAVEVYAFGLNPNRESTDGDKFDDGQELFGITYCPGSGTACGYGLLPRSADLSWGYITNNMPSWVSAPGSAPLVAAYPVIQVDPLVNTAFVTMKQITSTERIVTQGESKAVGTAKTTGKSTTTGTIDTNSVRNWQETSNTNIRAGSSPSVGQTQADGNSQVSIYDNVHVIKSSAGLLGQLRWKQTQTIASPSGTILQPPICLNPNLCKFYLPWQAGNSYILWQGPKMPGTTHATLWAWDFGLPIGTPVLATRSGRVLSVNNDPTPPTSGYGRFVIVDHMGTSYGDGKGTASLYAHLSTPIVKEGDWIDRGQVIGYSGWTGLVIPPGPNGAHLHFHVMPNQKADCATFKNGPPDETACNTTFSIEFSDAKFPNGENPHTGVSVKPTSQNIFLLPSIMSPPATSPECLNRLFCSLWVTSKSFTLGQSLLSILGQSFTTATTNASFTPPGCGTATIAAKTVMQVDSCVNQVGPTSNITDLFSDARTGVETGGSVTGSGLAVNNNGDKTLSYLPIHFETTTTGQGTETSHSDLRSQSEYEELTTNEVNTVLSSEGWSTATTVDSTHAADLTFGFIVKNIGSDAAVAVNDLRFTISFGPDVPEITWPSIQNPGISFTNLFPGRNKPDSGNFTAGPIALSLDQVRAIDGGAPIRIIVADYTYGSDQQFYEDALGNSVLFHIDDGNEDDDQKVDTYMVPTWGTEYFQDVLKRAFEVGEYPGPESDRIGNLISLRTPEFDTNHNVSTWQTHAVGAHGWWDVALSSFDASVTSFKLQPAQIRSHIFMTYYLDSDGDNYPDRIEDELGMDKNDATMHPRPVMIAAKRTDVNGSAATIQLSLQNNGNFDASSVEAWLIARDDSITVTDGFIGGGGRVRAGQRVVLGARIGNAVLTNWARSTAKPIMSGQFTGAAANMYTITANNSGTVGVTSGLQIGWSNGTNSGTLNIGSGYTPLTPLLVSEGVQVAFTSGDIRAGDTFTSATALPVDMFRFTINRTPYTTPNVLISYNDPSGNHKFLTEIEVTEIQSDLTTYQAQMSDGLGLDIVTQASFAPGSNATSFVFNNPAQVTLAEGKLFVEFATASGTVVKEVASAQTFQPGPNIVNLTWNTSEFAPAFNASESYRIVAFATDRQGTIIDSSARLFSTFAVDSTPVLNTFPATWNIGTVTQGAQPQQTISIVNTGIMPLNVVVNSSDPKLTLSGANGIISVPPAGTYPVNAMLDTTTLSGSVAMSLTIRSNDPAHQTVTVPINGTVNTSAAAASVFDIANRPLDKTVRVYGNVSQFSTVDFTHGIQPDTATIEPCKIYAADGTTLKGVGKYCADFNAGTVSAQVFGTGADGALNVTGNQTINNTRTALSATSNAGQPILNVSSTSGFAIGQEVLIHQTQGTNAGNYEFGKIASIGSGTLTLQANLSNTYTQGGNSHAQVVWVPQYTDVTVQSGGTLTAPAWDGSTGGILIFRALNTTTVSGLISLTGKGFRGGMGLQVAGNSESYSGESPTSTSARQFTANGTGGGGGRNGGSNGGDGQGGGGGYATSGQNGTPLYSSTPPDGFGGGTTGDAGLTTFVFGGGGGAGGGGNLTVGQNGGQGGGAIILMSQNIVVSGGIRVDGAAGGNGINFGGYWSMAGGGGAGGAIILKGQTLSLGSNLVTATSGSGGSGGGNGGGGAGGVGRIRIEYQNITAGWSTNPSASAQQVTYYSADSTTNVSFGTGPDGPLTVTSNQTINNTRTALSTTSNAGQPTLSVASTSGFAVGQEVLIHQTQGTGAGNYEFGKIAGIGSGILTLQSNLQNTYTQGGNSHAQVIRVPNYTNVTVQNGGTLSAPAWDGSTGGILVFRANGTFNAIGNISSNGADGGTCTGAGCQIDGSIGGGFRGGRGINTGSNPAYQGESTAGIGTNSKNPNVNGGGGAGSPVSNGSPGGGGGHANAGQNGQQSDPGIGGNSSGMPNLSTVIFGGAGGGGTEDSGPTKIVGAGGNGGGIVLIFANTISVSGAITSNGGKGGDSNQDGGGGGGAGGSIFLRGQNVTLGNSLVTSSGGAGGIGAGRQAGGNGSVGRIRVEYCDTLSGTTNPIASTQKLTCFIADKPDAATIHFTVPDAVTSPGQNYVMHFTRRLPFTGAGNQTTYTRVVSQTYSSATMDALITNVGAGGATNLQIQVGNTTVYSQTQTITQPTTINLPNFASAVNQYIVSQPSASTVDVPMRVTINRQADVLLTNLGVTPGAGVDLVVNPSDIVVGCPGGAACLASEGNTIPISVTVHNNGAQNAASAVVGYYVGDPQNGGRLLGNSYVATIPAGGATTANFNWNTEGFTHTQTLFAFVDPPNAIAETLENNNIVSKTLYVKTKPDLRVASIALSSTDRVVGEPITATLVISNTGETTSSTSTARLEELGERGDSSTQDISTGTIAPTSTITIARQLLVSQFGTRVITVTADATNAITESIESNNVMTRTVSVGINAKNIDAGSAGDLAYNSTSGYGYLNGETYDFGTPSGTVTKTVRYNGSGTVQYRFDGLQPSRFYHLDATFYQEGESFNQLVLFDSVDSGRIVSLTNGQSSTTSILLPAATYSDGSVVVSFQRQSGGAAVQTRFRKPGSSVGPAFVSQVTLTPVEYIYLDAGGASDVAYDATRGYGYLSTNTPYASSLGGTEALNTFRTVFGNTLNYQFSRLTPSKNYLLNLTLYDGASSTRVEGVSINGSPISSCWNLAVNSIQRLQCPIDPAQYATGTITVGIVCSSCTAPRLNEIALEQKTRDIIGSTVGPTPTPVPSPGTNVSAFSAQWSANLVQVNWSTVAESKTDKFQVWRSPTISPAAWTLVRTQPSQSNCASVTTPYAYNYTDNTVTAGQTYYYKLTWAGDTCGGSGGAYPTNATAYAFVNTSLLFGNGWNLITLPISPTITHTASSLAGAINAQGGGCTEVDRWHNGGWDSHAVGLPPNDFEIQQNVGYFVKCNKSNAWSYQGTPLGQGIALNLSTGWNSVGIPNAPITLTAESLTDNVNAQGGNCVEIDRWLNGGWDSHLNNVAFNNFTVETNKGYFIQCTQPSAYLLGSAINRLVRPPIMSRAQRNLLASPIISKMQLTNVRDTSATISWVTNQPTHGWVNFGTTGTLDQTGYDDRDALLVATTHHVTLINLAPNTTYYFDLVSDGTVDNNQGGHYSFKTGPMLSLPKSDVVYGQVFRSDGTTPAEGTLVYLTLTDHNGIGSAGTSAPLSAVVDRFGYWIANLGNLRTGSLSGYYTYSANGDTLTIQAEGAMNGTGSHSTDSSTRTPAPTILLQPNSFYYLPLIAR